LPVSLQMKASGDTMAVRGQFLLLGPSAKWFTSCVQTRTMCYCGFSSKQRTLATFLCRGISNAISRHWRKASPPWLSAGVGKGHSGSPFRQSILRQSERCRQYVVAGLLEARLVPEHLKFITQHCGRYYWRSDLSLSAIEGIYANLPDPMMVSFDMDAVDRAFAPGVSAPATGGMSCDLWRHACAMAGRNPGTLSMDLVEVNPQFDTDRRTVLLAAESVLEFLRGMSERSAPLSANT
jgi:hypothetical protein